mmetsp:Transcript_30450/g.49801  ORF Transcript_30450/g.49801 Transcript_30450/m.49801 type:complete len:553 (-) Transcript_30450:394-2052(-)
MFGVDWSDLEDDHHKLDQDSRQQQQPHRAHRRNESVGSTVSNADDPSRIDRVKQRCIAQNSAFSVWWKVSIQTYIQQRMWMQLGGSPAGSSLPPRFDRLYRPNELSHFDKVFARPWATPFRLSHEDQHKSSLDDGELGSAGLSPRKATPKESKITMFDERFQSSKGHDEQDKTTEEDQGYVSLRDYVNTNGFNAKNRSSLNQLIDAHAYKPQHAFSNDEQSEKPTTWRGDTTLHYLGSLKEKVEPCAKYVDYASNSTIPQRSFRPGRREEFAACLSRVGVGIDSNDVQGIRKIKLAESAHICQELQSGPYRGLNQNESAVRVATTIHGYFNYLEEKVEEGELSYNEIHPPELLETLKQTDLYSVGVTESFYSGWKHLAKAEKSYSEIVDMSSIGYRRSDITTDSSMKLYSSFFDQSSEISPLEHAYAIGERLPNDPTKPLRRSTRPCEKVSGPDKDLRSFDEASFILKAASRGINIRKKSSRSRDKDDNINIIEFHTQRPIPAGFEQINEDLFARKDNKFMVFNGAGVDSWKSPPQPVTKTHRGIDILAALK